MKKLNNHNLMMRESTSFNRAIAMQHVIDGPKTVKALAKAMFISEVIAWQHLSWLYTNEFAKATMVREFRMVKAYEAINAQHYVWPKSYLASNDPRRDYFDKMIYPNITKELRDAIYEGRISPDIIKTYNRENTIAWELKYKPNYHGNFQSSMNGEYFV
jgi:hypothetical protein